MSAIPPPPTPVAEPKQITFPNVVIDAQPLPDGEVVILMIAAPGETMLFPMSVEYAQNLGRKLTAPHVIPATNGQGPPMPGVH
jgi:hypothetical protein